MNRKPWMIFAAGLVTGLTALLLMGASHADSDNGRYQISAFSAAAGNGQPRGWAGYYVIDTRTGKVVESKVERQHY